MQGEAPGRGAMGSWRGGEELRNFCVPAYPALVSMGVCSKAPGRLVSHPENICPVGLRTCLS